MHTSFKIQKQIFIFQDFEDREQGQVVIYFTTLGVVRETWARCVKIRQILRNLLIKVEERDVFMCRENQIEVMERLNTLEVSLPHVFVDGHHIGVRFLKRNVKKTKYNNLSKLH